LCGVNFTYRHVLFTRHPACKITTTWGLKPLRLTLTPLCLLWSGEANFLWKLYRRGNNPGDVFFLPKSQLDGILQSASPFASKSISLIPKSETIYKTIIMFQHGGVEVKLDRKRSHTHGGLNSQNNLTWRDGKVTSRLLSPLSKVRFPPPRPHKQR